MFSTKQNSCVHTRALAQLRANPRYRNYLSGSLVRQFSTFTRRITIVVSIAMLASCSTGSSTLSSQTSSLTWHVQDGASSRAEALQGLAFYPSAMTIDAGDTVEWSFPANEPHTVSLLGSGQTKPLPPTDPAAAKPAGGSTYDGTAYTSSGYLFGGKTYSLTFPKQGTYTIYCLIHQPEMVSKVVVQPRGTAYPQQQSAYDQAAATASASDLAAALASVGTFAYPAGSHHFAAGISPGSLVGPPGSSSILRFLSTSSLDVTSATVPAGSTVTWTNLSNNEAHTVTFAPVGRPFPTLNPFAPPTGGNTYDGTTLVNSGLLFPGQSFSVTFPKAGIYTYHCLLHDDTENMIATLVVQ